LFSDLPWPTKKFLHSKRSQVGVQKVKYWKSLLFDTRYPNWIRYTFAPQTPKQIKKISSFSCGWSLKNFRGAMNVKRPQRWHFISVYFHRSVLNHIFDLGVYYFWCRLPGKWSGSSKVGFVSSRLLELFHMTNCISKWSIFRKTVESEIKNDVKKWFFSRWFHGLDTGSKEEEFRKLLFLFKSKLSRLVINDDHSDSSYSLNKIILDLSPVFFGLVEAGNWQPGSGLLSR